MSETTKTEYITAKKLKEERGWTDSLIKKYLPNPDETKTNPYYRSGPKMRLFKIDRVNEIEKKEDFIHDKVKTDKRKESTQDAVLTKKCKLRSYIKDIEIYIPHIEKKSLIKESVDHYNDLHFDQGKRAFINDDEVFLNRICVNYLRHEASVYETELEKIKGKTGKIAAYSILKERILEQIAKQYDWLEEECNNQKDRLNNFIYYL